MIKLIIGIICYFVLYSSYYIYKNIKTPVYNRIRDLKYYINKEIDENIEAKYMYKPYKNELKKNDKIDYHFYLSSVEHIDLNRYIKEKYIDYDKNFFNVYNFTNTIYNWDEKKIKKKKKWMFFTENVYPSFDIVIPDELCKRRKHIYLHIITYVNNQLYRYGTTTTLLTNRKEPDEKEKTKKFLWEDFFKEEEEEKEKEKNSTKNKTKKAVVNSIYILKHIQFGPIIEYNELDINKLGFFSNIFINKFTNTYFLPIHVNNYLTPEDEYELLLNKTERDEKNKDNNLKHINKIKIEYVPVSYIYFSLFNLLIFNINYIKQKYSFSSYDLDSLLLSLCGNTYLSLFIYFICLIHLIIDIITTCFDINTWENLNDSYLVYIWKILNACDIFIYTVYPFIYINKKPNLNHNNPNIIKFENNMKKKLNCTIIFSVIIIFFYNFVYNKHDSFYSLIITTLGVCSYIFNFILMLPQIVRNYYRKTVHYMPLFSFVLLFLNAVMDDLLALFLRMPTIHRFNVLGDDIVFIVFLVQYCLYKKEKKIIVSHDSQLIEESKKRR